jgi:hypothetical protein
VGFGDELLLSGIVKKAYEARKRPIALGRYGKNYFNDEDPDRILWTEIFDNNPKIDRNPGLGAVWIDGVKGNRPYIDYYNTEPGKTVYKPFRPEPGEIFFTEEELARYADLSGFVYIEPNVKGSFGGNKDWGFEKWQEVVERLPYEFIQGRGRQLEGVRQIDTISFRDACALLSRSALFLGTDGGMHHAAAALGIPAVVVWGGLVGPEILGYDSHINLRGEGVRSCGSNSPCQHCRDAMAKVSVEMVVEAVEGCNLPR